MIFLTSSENKHTHIYLDNTIKVDFIIKHYK